MRNKILFSILVVFLYILLCDCATLTFYDDNLKPRQIVTYSDNSVVFRLVERLNDTCNVPNLTYRILYPNGTDNLITVNDHQIPSFNFCNIYSTRKDIQVSDSLRFEKTITNYILVTYDNFSGENNTRLTFA